MSETLRNKLSYDPVPLRFGTSGRRGEVIHLSQLEVYINALAELRYLQSLPLGLGGIRQGQEFFIAYDLRPSSTEFVPTQQGRGEIAQAIERAITDAGMTSVNLGPIPTPALSFHAFQLGRGSMMITGSHIPFDRNGYKTNSSVGELLKKDEAPIQNQVERLRKEILDQPFSRSPFDQNGFFKSGHRDLSPPSDAARLRYTRRYVDFFGAGTLDGLPVLAYQHSAVGRDILVDILSQLGATVTSTGRSDSFVPIDTENIDAAQLAAIQTLVDEAPQSFAVLSTDGDSDRPLLLGIDSGQVSFFGGDLVGMVVAEYLRADAVVVPISCNDAIDRGPLKNFLEPKTRIGSPYVIEGMDRARNKGRKAVCGWEANGGFLLGSDIEVRGRRLASLPTRDAMLPLLATLFTAVEARSGIAHVFSRLPRRFSRAALIRNFPRATSSALIRRFSPTEPTVVNVAFHHNDIEARDAQGAPIDADLSSLKNIRNLLEQFFLESQGFSRIASLNYTDGVRITFSNGEVAHIRPSGNADELRIYAVADQQVRADEITALGVSPERGILLKMASA